MHPSPVTFGLYVHLPFCKRKCAYCDFISYPNREEEITGYIQTLLTEWAAVRSELLKGTPFSVSSCYLGGGTPSLLDENQLHILVEGLFPQGIPENMEFSIEVNPESLTASRLACYRDLGINRISLGVQSFNDKSLQQLGRIHTVKQAETAIVMIQDNGWENHNIDLMYGLPEQSPRDFTSDLTRALDFHVPHLSAYSLTINPATPFGKRSAAGKLLLPQEEKMVEMMDTLEEKTASAGLQHYETSNFSRPGFACKHNLTYWRLAPYIGLGLGAVSFFTRDCGPWGAHWENPVTFQDYEEVSRSGKWPFLSRISLSCNAAFMEALLTGLRLQEGLETNQLRSRFGKKIVGEMLREVTPLLAEGWLEQKDGYLRATQQGSRILDALILELVSELK
jgi:oxygen-independent coproporphyrinogen-3 oxidase